MSTPLPGCRHDVLGHALKAVGVLHALAQCAEPANRDPDAEGWWNLKEGRFEIRSRRYPNSEALTTFFAAHYQPTPVIAAWNKGGGITDKVTGKKGETLPSAAQHMPTLFQDCLDLARAYAQRLQAAARDDPEGSREYRDQMEDVVAQALDALCSVHLPKVEDNPVFLKRGRPGDKANMDIFLNFWAFYLRFRKHSAQFVGASLFGGRLTVSGGSKKDLEGKGTPFFPDAIKSFNQGLEWVTETFPFCPLDYLLAVEGALALRGGVSKSLGAHGRPYAAFPFVFEGSDVMTDTER